MVVGAGAQRVWQLPLPKALIGREADITRLIELIATSRIVTVVGAGGVGKTTLAVDVVRRTAPSFPDGVAFVDLADLDDPAALATEIARRLDLVDASASDSREHLITYLSGRRAVIVLDNFEHLIEAAPLIAELSAHCPHVVWLVTSRRRLGVTAERLLDLAALPVPAVGGEGDIAGVASVALFCERAAAVSPQFQDGAEDLEAVGELCRRVDGLPLAIELVAAQVRVLPPRQLLTRMAEADEGLRLLRGGPVDADARHRDLRRTIGWSVELLGVAAANLLRSLSVFREGWTLDALEAVSGGDLPPDLTFEALVELVDMHLVEPVEVDGDEARFRLLETVRQFAGESLDKAGETGPVRDRHADYFVSFAARAGAGLESRDERRWAARVARELPNIRAAMRHLWATGRAELGLSVATALGPHWLDRATMSEGREWISRFLTPTTGSPDLRAIAEGWDGRFAAELGEVDVAAEGMARMRRAREVLEHAGNTTAWLRISCQLVAVLRLGGQRADAEAVVVDTMARAGQSERDWFWAELLQMDAILTLDRGDYEHLATLVEPLIPMARDVGHDRVRANALTYRAWALVGRAGAAPSGVFDAQAAVDADEAYALSREIGDRRGAARAAAAGGIVALGEGALDRAAALYLRCLDVAIAMGYWRYIGWSMMGAVALAAQSGCPADGARVFGAMVPSLDLIRTQTPKPMIPGFDAAVNHLRDELGEDFESAAEEGERAGWVAAIDSVRQQLTEMAEEAAPPGFPSGDRSDREADPRLTRRELEVLRLLVAGSTNRQIAKELSISAKTVMHHTMAVYRKLAVRGRAAAVADAIRRGLVAG